MWWKGPPFLLDPPEKWPVMPTSQNTADVDQEVAGHSVATLLQKQLNLFLNEEGVIRCQGRIDHSTVPESNKTPILMPKRHHFTELLIMHRHNQVFHDGIHKTLNLIRETHWIRRGREAVKRVLCKCIICRRYEGKAMLTPPIPQLPQDRVEDHPPFAVTGVDFAGPIFKTRFTFVCLPVELPALFI